MGKLIPVQVTARGRVMGGRRPEADSADGGERRMTMSTLHKQKKVRNIKQVAVLKR